MSPTQFDHEKLDVYCLELEFLTWATALMQEADASPHKRLGEVISQLDRASLSILLNTAEGNGKRQRRVRAKFFDDARGSATECAACLDALVAKKACDHDRILHGKELLIRIASMLSKLVEYFDHTNQVHEEGPAYPFGEATGSENENDNENDDEDDF